MMENDGRFLATESETAVYVVMGVSGCGKSTVGQALALRLGCSFLDGDDFHPPQNVAKMAGGIPLTDADRLPWLERLAAEIMARLTKGETAVIACSALKKTYRDVLRVSEQVCFIFLHGDFDLIWHRLQQRQGHFMKPEMLRSQFADLEPPPPAEAWQLDAAAPVDTVVAEILRRAGTA